MDILLAFIVGAILGTVMYKVASHYLEEKTILAHKDWEGLPKWTLEKLKTWGQIDGK